MEHATTGTVAVDRCIVNVLDKKISFYRENVNDRKAFQFKMSFQCFVKESNKSCSTAQPGKLVAKNLKKRETSPLCTFNTSVGIEVGECLHVRVEVVGGSLRLRRCR